MKSEAKFFKFFFGLVQLGHIRAFRCSRQKFHVFLHEYQRYVRTIFFFGRLCRELCFFSGFFAFARFFPRIFQFGSFSGFVSLLQRLFFGLFGSLLCLFGSLLGGGILFYLLRSRLRRCDAEGGTQFYRLFFLSAAFCFEASGVFFSHVQLFNTK